MLKTRRKIKFKIKLFTMCIYCEADLADTWDHIIPWSEGGDDSKDNLVPACRRCNSLAHNFLFESFDDKKAYIKDRLKLSKPHSKIRRRIIKRKKKQVNYAIQKITKERPGVPEVTEIRYIVPTEFFYIEKDLRIEATPKRLRVERSISDLQVLNSELHLSKVVVGSKSPDQNRRNRTETWLESFNGCDHVVSDIDSEWATLEGLGSHWYCSKCKGLHPTGKHD